MKRFLLTGLMFLTVGLSASYAQKRGSYSDDIYYNSTDAKKEAEAQKSAQQGSVKQGKTPIPARAMM